jgi:hypothetical protein
LKDEGTTKKHVKETMKACVPTYKEPEEVNGE